MGRRAHHHAGRATAMTGHHPWGELTKHFTPEDRKIVEAGPAEIVVDSDWRECGSSGPSGRLTDLRMAELARHRPRLRYISVPKRPPASTSMIDSPRGEDFR